MESILIDSTPKTPSIYFDATAAQLDIKGRSIPENSVEFYRPMMEWLDKYAPTPGKKTLVNIQLEYFNTSSSKCILDIFKKLEAIHKKGDEMVINWFYEEDDEDMQEAGEDYQAIIQIPFKMQMIK